MARSRRPGLVGAEARGSGEGGGAPPTPTRAEARCARRHHVRRRACARASLRARDRAERRRGEQLVPTRATRQSSSAPRTLAPGPHARARAAPTMATPESPVRPSVRPSDDRRRTKPEWPPRRGARGTRPIERRRRRPAAGAKIFAILSPYCSRICFRFERLQAVAGIGRARRAPTSVRPPHARDSQRPRGQGTSPARTRDVASARVTRRVAVGRRGAPCVGVVAAWGGQEASKLSRENERRPSRQLRSRAARCRRASRRVDRDEGGEPRRLGRVLARAGLESICARRDAAALALLPRATWDARAGRQQPSSCGSGQ